MEIGPEILGYGSSGTLVFEGTLDGRPIAVKRILCQVCKVFPICPVVLAMRMPDHCSGGQWDTIVFSNDRKQSPTIHYPL